MTLTFDAHPRSSLIVALDFDSLSTAVKFARQVADLVGMFKIGNQLFTAAGPAAVKEVAALGTGIFLDLKFHDIPNTVAGAVLSSAAMTGVQLVNVHALGGKPMLEAAVQAISAGVPMGADRPRLLAVTILTSMDQKTMKEVGIGGPPKLRVVKLAQLAKKRRRSMVSSLRCWKQERFARLAARDFLIVTPGVRPKDSAVESKSEDQARESYTYRSDSRRRRFLSGWQADSCRTGSPRGGPSHRRGNRCREVACEV